MPPVQVIVVEPVVALQATDTEGVARTRLQFGLQTNVAEVVVVQPLPSVTVTEYVPAARLEMVAVVAPFVQLKV